MVAAAIAATLLQSGVRAGKTSTGIAYDLRGSGPVIVLLTGSNLDRRMWDREAAWLSKTHTVVRYDLRAHGQSDTVTAPFSMLGDLIGLMDTLKIEKATLIGLSAGATIALDAALAIPDRIERIVLAGPAPSGYIPRVNPPFILDLLAALATFNVIIDKAHRLHVRIHRRRTNKGPATLLQVLGQADRGW